MSLKMNDKELFRGGVNCCFRHVVHQLMRRISGFRNSEHFRNYLIRVRELQDNAGLRQTQEDAGHYLLNVLENERWARQIWNRECGIRFVEWKKLLTPQDQPARWSCKRGMVDKEPMIFVYPQTGEDLTICIKNSLKVETPDIILYKRIQHPPPRYLVLNMTGKVSTPTPFSFFSDLRFSPTVIYTVVGFILHLGPASGQGGHYVYVTYNGYVHDDMAEGTKYIPNMKDINFTSTVSPSVILYQRVSKRTSSRATTRRLSTRDDQEEAGLDSP